MFAPRKYRYQKEATGNERPEMYSASRFKKPYIPVRSVKISCLEGGGIRPRTESCVIWDGPIAMLPCLHQGSVYTKRKLRVWRDQKCSPLVGAKTILTCAGRQNTPSRMRRYCTQNRSCVICDGPIAMVPCLHQGNIYAKRKLRVWTEQICIQQVGATPPLTSSGR